MNSTLLRRKLFVILTWLARKFDKRQEIMGSDYPVICRFCGLPKHWHIQKRFSWQNSVDVPFEPAANGNQLTWQDLTKHREDVMGKALNAKSS